MNSKSHVDDDYSDIFDDAGNPDVPVETHPDCADIFDDGKLLGEPVQVDPDIADVICCDATPSKAALTVDHGAEGQVPWPVGSFRAPGASDTTVLIDAIK